MPSDTSLTTTIPFLLGGGDSGSRSGVFTLATLGLSCTLLRFVMSAMQDADSNKKRINNDDSGNDLVQRSQLVYQFVRTILRRLLLKETSKGQLTDDGASADDGDDDEDTAPILHQGSCHCRSVCFEVRLSRRSSVFLSIPIWFCSIYNKSLPLAFPHFFL